MPEVSNITADQTEPVLPKAVVTAKGYDLVAKLMITGEKIHFEGAAVDDGTLPYGVSLDTLEDVVHKRMDAQIASAEFLGNGKARVTTQVNGAYTPQSFLMTGVAIYARDPDVGRICYAYASFQDSPRQIYTVITLDIIDLNINVGGVKGITFELAPSAVLTTADMERFALRQHIHVFADVTGLPEWMAAMEQRTGAIESLLSNDMLGADTLAWSFADIADFEVIEGIHDPERGVIMAGGVA